MQSVSSGVCSHEMSKPILEKKKTYSQFVVCWYSHESGKGKIKKVTVKLIYKYRTAKSWSSLGILCLSMIVDVDVFKQLRQKVCLMRGSPSIYAVWSVVVWRSVDSQWRTEITGQTVRDWYTDNPLYTDTRYNDKIRYNDNLTVTKSSLQRKQLVRNYARTLYLIL